MDSNLPFSNRSSASWKDWKLGLYLCPILWHCFPVRLGLPRTVTHGIILERGGNGIFTAKFSSGLQNTPWGSRWHSCKAFPKCDFSLYMAGGDGQLRDFPLTRRSRAFGLRTGRLEAFKYFDNVVVTGLSEGRPPCSSARFKSSAHLWNPKADLSPVAENSLYWNYVDGVRLSPCYLNKNFRKENV